MIMDYPYFAYGSNMNLDQMSRRCPGAILGDIGYLQDWRYFINGRGYAGIEEYKGGVIWGCLWTLTDPHWLALDQYEGVAGGYYKRKILSIVIEKNKEQRSASLYLSNDYRYGIPSKRYQEIVVAGAKDIILPSSYITELEVWRNGPPSHFNR
jgi:gamma-glutamylcyclotransferase (GGCT)/AIG2-like uncharacterized protein YtfP